MREIVNVILCLYYLKLLNKESGAEQLFSDTCLYLLRPRRRDTRYLAAVVSKDDRKVQERNFYSKDSWYFELLPCPAIR